MGAKKLSISCREASSLGGTSKEGKILFYFPNRRRKNNWNLYRKSFCAKKIEIEICTGRHARSGIAIWRRTKIETKQSKRARAGVRQKRLFLQIIPWPHSTRWNGQLADRPRSLVGVVYHLRCVCVWVRNSWLSCDFFTVHWRSIKRFYN